MICPYCRVDLPSQNAAVCTACGQKLPGKNEAPRPAVGNATLGPLKASQKIERRRRKKKKETQIPEVMGEPVDNGYDGYYNDVLPPDVDRINEGLDTGLIKDIILLCTAAILIISLCIAILYML